MEVWVIESRRSPDDDGNPTYGPRWTFYDRSNAESTLKRWNEHPVDPDLIQVPSYRLTRYVPADFQRHHEVTK